MLKYTELIGLSLYLDYYYNPKCPLKNDVEMVPTS